MIILGVLSIGIAIPSDELLRTDTGADEVPEVLVFDCDPRSEIKHESLLIFDRNVHLPAQFQKYDSDDVRYVWNLQTTGASGELDLVPLASLWTGTWRQNPTTEMLIQEFVKVSSAGENGFGLEIYVQTHRDESRLMFEEVMFVGERDFLKVVSITPVDWASLLSCFE